MLITLLIIALPILTVCACQKEAVPKAAPVVATVNRTLSQPEEPEALARAKEYLVKNSFPPALAEKLVNTNRRLLTVLYEEDPPLYQEILARLGRLGPRVEIHSQLSQYPEVAGLAAGALEADPAGATKILRSLPANEQQRDVVYAMYTFFHEPVDAVFLAERLEVCRDIMIELWLEDLNFLLPFLVRFSGPACEEAQAVYLQWVEDAYRQAFRFPESNRQRKLEETLAFLIYHGDTVKELLRSDVSFREAFLRTYWPGFKALLQQKLEGTADPEVRAVLWASYVEDPRVWQFLHDYGKVHSVPAAFEVFEHFGCVAVDLWLAPEFREQAVRERLLKALESADEEVIYLLADPNLRKEPLFPQFLRRQIPQSTFISGLWKLAECGNDRAKIHERLLYWNSLSDKALVEELGPPPEGILTYVPGYNICYLLHKWQQGRTIHAGDIGWAAFEVISFIPVAGGGGKLFTVASKKTAESLARGCVKHAARKGATKILAATAERNIAQTFAGSFLRQSFSTARVDVTASIRLAFQTFKRLGFGRQAFRNLTGLEARIFMRSDRVVFLNLGALASPRSPVARILTETAENAGIDVAAKSDLGQAAIGQTLEAARTAWREYLSIAWLARGHLNKGEGPRNEATP